MHNPFNDPVTVFNKSNYTIIDQQSQTLLCWQLYIWTNLIPLRHSCFVRLVLVLSSKCYDGLIHTPPQGLIVKREYTQCDQGLILLRSLFHISHYGTDLTFKWGKFVFGEFDLKCQWRKWTQNFINFDPFMTLFSINTELSFANLCKFFILLLLTSSLLLLTS